MDILEILWDLNQQKRIDQSEQDIGEARQRIADVKDDVEVMRKQIRDLTLICTALTQLLQTKLGLTPDEVKDHLVRAADTLKAQTRDLCEKCGRRYHMKLNRCIYCGHVNAA